MLKHFHHWTIDDQAGKFSWGECDCGSSRLFRNAPPETNMTPKQAKQERLNAQRSARLKGRVRVPS